MSLTGSDWLRLWITVFTNTFFSCCWPPAYWLGNLNPVSAFYVITDQTEFTIFFQLFTAIFVVFKFLQTLRWCKLYLNTSILLHLSTTYHPPFFSSSSSLLLLLLLLRYRSGSASNLVLPAVYFISISITIILIRNVSTWQSHYKNKYRQWLLKKWK